MEAFRFISKGLERIVFETISHFPAIMVMTFIAALLDDSTPGREVFRRTAEILDNKRIGKQRVEAMQILRSLVGYRILAFHFQHFRSNESVFVYLQSLLRLYTAENFCLVVDHDCSSYELFPREFERLEYPGRWVFRTSFSLHKAVVMWFGYEDALKEYVNIMIEEHIRRGYVNTMHRYTLSSEIKYPWWMSSHFVVGSHSIALFKKNRDHYFPIFGNLADIFNRYPDLFALREMLPRFLDLNDHLVYYWPTN